jgi:hypothetical protein
MKLIKEEKLLFGLPIKIKNLGTIYQPTLEDYINNNIDIQNFIGLFSIKIDLLIENNDKGLKNFDFFLLQMTQNKKGDMYIQQLIKYLKLLYKTDDVKFIDISNNDLNSIGISVKVNNEEYFINRDNYDKLAEVVLITLGNGNNVKEKEVKEELNEIDLKIAKKRKEFERKKAEREAKLRKESNKDNEPLTIFDLVNYIIHADNTQYNYSNVLKLTVYQIMNTFRLYQTKESYKIGMDYRTSGNFKIEEKLNHWFFKNN